MRKKFYEYLKLMLIQYEVVGECVEVNNEYYYIPDEYDNIFEIHIPEELQIEEVTKFVYEFGGRWYVQEFEKDYDFKEFVYIGKAKQNLPTPSFLGIHSGYELMNGVGLYKDWVKKAKFLGIEALGICEKNTLSGALAFQLECQKNDIKSILGIEVKMKEGYTLKVYCKNQDGWFALLKLNTIINIEEKGYIEENELKRLKENLFIIADPKSLEFKNCPSFINYFQLDTVEFEDSEKDEWYLDNLEQFIKSGIKPISIYDAYYLEQQDYHTREFLWDVSKSYDYKTQNQYFKNRDQYAKELINMFDKSSNGWVNLFKKAIENEAYLISECNFVYDTKNRHLPKYLMSEEEASQFDTSEELFLHLIKKGMKERNIPRDRFDEYLERVKIEIDVLRFGNVVDYFLTLNDILNWAKSQGIITGIGRGSAGGSLVAYLLNITQVDPLQYGLLFERFLNKGRVLSSLPDIDSDFQGSRRSEVKQYMEQRFGKSQVASVGTYTTFQLKGIVKDIARVVGIEFSQANILSSIMSETEDVEAEGLGELILKSTVEPLLKSFIKNNSDYIYMIPSLLKQPKAKSIHACATILSPSDLKSEEWAPCRTQGEMIVTEWTGEMMDSAGFLKNDILGIKQLDKFAAILKLIKANGKEIPDIYNLPHDPEVYRFTGNGWNGDVFQFGAAGLSDFCKTMRPQTMYDLIAAVAIFRPGPMHNGYHLTYCKCKNDGRTPTFLWGTEHITQETYGLIIYQEQVMNVFQDLGNLTLVEADDIRRALGKMNLKYLMMWKEKVKEGFLSNGSTEENFESTWDAMAEFAKYSFNKSHSTTYAMTGYISQYLKVNYPIEFWTVALEYANDKETLNYLSEIIAAKTIGVKPPDINKSEINMTSDQSTNSIFWGIGSIKGIGEDTAHQIIDERKKNGAYLSLEDFMKRSTFVGSKVKKQTYEALISSGCFDILNNIEKGETKKRWDLIKEFRTIKKVKPAKLETDPYTVGQLEETWWWELKQKELTGLSLINYKEIAENEGFSSQFCTQQEFIQRQDKGIYRVFGGYIIEVKVGKSAKGPFARLKIEHNYKTFTLIIWAKEYALFKERLQKCEKSLIIFEGRLQYDDKYSNSNQFMLSEDSHLAILK